MEKTILHWKAEHPSLIIALLLVLGIGLSLGMEQNGLALCTKKFLYIVVVLSWVLLILIHLLSKNSFSKSIYTIICLVFWGYCIVQLKTNTTETFVDYVDPFIQPLRQKMLNKIDFFIHNNNNNQFAKALLIGQRNHIDPTLMEAYTALGIVHIIAISGMHLDIVAQYLSKLTGWLPKNKYIQLFELLFLVTVISLYTLIAHASPSIVRAAVFFCLYKIGGYFNLQRYVFNSIASGLLIIVLINYQTIGNIGWQLSYAAVLGIHLVHPRINKTIQLRNPIIQFIWNNFSITLSTQLTTLPLLVYYFHTLSTGIILSNMVMIPISNLLLEALLLLVIVPIYWVKALYWGQIIEWYMQKMALLVQYIFTISPQPLYITSISIYYMLAYYLIFLYLCVWKKRYNQPLFQYSTKTA